MVFDLWQISVVLIVSQQLYYLEVRKASLLPDAKQLLVNFPLLTFPTQRQGNCENAPGGPKHPEISIIPGYVSRRSHQQREERETSKFPQTSCTSGSLLPVQFFSFSYSFRLNNRIAPLWEILDSPQSCQNHSCLCTMDGLTEMLRLNYVNFRILQYSSGSRWGGKGPCLTPSPLKIGHEKYGHRRRP